MNRIFVLLLIFLSVFIPLDIMAVGPGANLPRATPVPSAGNINRTAVVPGRPAVEYYNRLVTPQFRFSEILPGGVFFPIWNGGIGDGGHHAFFCGGNDEVRSFRNLRGAEGIGVYDEWGQYRVFRLEDRCRTEGGCGQLAPDGKSYLIGFPEYATNCYPWGKKGFWDDPLFMAAIPDAPPSDALPFSPSYQAWANRNMINDSYGFIFGRYLINQVVFDAGSSSLEARFGLEFTVDESAPYSTDAASPVYLDIPYSGEHLAWGYTCSEICKANGYTKNSTINCRPSAAGRNREMDQEFLDHHKMLLETVVASLGNDIAAGSFGNVYTIAGVKKRETMETVVNVWVILREMLGETDFNSCSGVACGMARTLRGLAGQRLIEIHQCTNVPNAAIAEYRHAENKICIRSAIAGDCQAKRAEGSNADYNISGDYQGGHCYASYGEFQGSGAGKLMERGFGTVQGYLLRPRGAGDGDSTVNYVGAISAGWRPSDGYGAVMSSFIAHQMVHAYFQKKTGANRMAMWPNSDEALREEETAVMAQALTLSILEEKGFAPKDFSMGREDFIPTVQLAQINLPTGGTDQQVVGGTSGVRFFYADEPRGFGGIFLGPLFSNMRNIYRNLRDGNTELARMMALFHSMGPTLDPPKKMILSGERGDFRLPEITPRGPRLPATPQTTPAAGQTRRAIEPLPVRRGGQ